MNLHATTGVFFIEGYKGFLSPGKSVQAETDFGIRAYAAILVKFRWMTFLQSNNGESNSCVQQARMSTVWGSLPVGYDGDISRLSDGT